MRLRRGTWSHGILEILTPFRFRKRNTLQTVLTLYNRGIASRMARSCSPREEVQSRGGGYAIHDCLVLTQSPKLTKGSYFILIKYFRRIGKRIVSAPHRLEEKTKQIGIDVIRSPRGSPDDFCKPSSTPTPPPYGELIKDTVATVGPPSDTPTPPPNVTGENLADIEKQCDLGSVGSHEGEYGSAGFADHITCPTTRGALGKGRGAGSLALFERQDHRASKRVPGLGRGALSLAQTGDRCVSPKCFSKDWGLPL